MGWQEALVGTHSKLVNASDPWGVFSGDFEEIQARIYLSFWNIALFSGIEYCLFKIGRTEGKNPSSSSELVSPSPIMCLETAHNNTGNKFGFFFLRKVICRNKAIYSMFKLLMWHVTICYFHSSFNTGMLSGVEWKMFLFLRDSFTSWFCVLFLSFQSSLRRLKVNSFLVTRVFHLGFCC